MKLYKTKHGIVLQKENRIYKVDGDWDAVINDDHLFDKLTSITLESEPTADGRDLIAAGLQAPVGSQELWASGVTYIRSKQGRQEESEKTGGADFYGRVYVAERPELFFKATSNRIVGHGDNVRIRRDSSWDVPEPELTLMITSNEKIVGYTIGNDMSSRSIEGENPLYLPQAKTYDGCAALGPCIYVSQDPLPADTLIEIEIKRDDSAVFKDHVEISQIKRGFDELASFLYRECTFPNGVLLMTGTGIVPGPDFTLKSGDEINITIGPIGTLTNEVE